MKRFFIAAICLLVVAIAFWLVGCVKDENGTTPTSVGDVSKLNPKVETPSVKTTGGVNQGQSGTTLSDAVDGGGFPVCHNYFDWTCVKTMDPGPFRLCKNECQDVPISVSVTKGAQHFYLTGEICITNGGAVATTDLKVGATLMYHAGGGFTASSCNVSGLESQHPILAAGESYCYQYTINIAPGCLLSDNGSYRVDGNVTIMNHSGHLGVPWGPNGKSNSQSLCSPANDCINVTDVVGTPVDALGQSDATSWNITVAGGGQICQSGTVNFTATICNVSAPNEETWTVTNTAYVGTGDGSNHCSTDFGLSTVGCTPPNLGCSYTQGFWKTHGCVGPAGKSQYGHNPDLITPLLGSGAITMGNRVISTCTDAGAVFQGAQGNQGNAIKRLYSQMLAALLSHRNGADNSCIQQAIADANAVLSAADPNGDASGWTGISGANRSAVQSLASTFDQYNNGLLCVPHCE